MNTLLKKLFTLTTFSLALLPAQNAVHAQCKNSIDENIYKELPFNMPKVEQRRFLIIQSVSCNSEPKATELP